MRATRRTSHAQLSGVVGGSLYVDITGKEVTRNAVLDAGTTRLPGAERNVARMSRMA